MTELAKGLPESDKTAIAHATDLLTHYSFDLGHQTVSQLIYQWLKEFSAGWVRWAVIEALYQGRYKAVSVDQILRLWKRRNNPCYHFNYEFERLVCNKFPRDLNAKASEHRQVRSLPFPSEAPPSPIADAIISTSVVEDQEAAPAWVALAEQISRPVEASLAPLQGSEGTISPSYPQGVEPVSKVATSSLTKIEALLDRANFEPNAADQRSQGETIADSSKPPPDEVLEDHQPPIHQFTPTQPGSDFYAKLKAVAEQNGENV
ncbi:hypothetical protein [Phormidesmis priestleyi]